MFCVFILPQIVLGLLFRKEEKSVTSISINSEKKVLGTSINLDSEKIIALTNKERLTINLDTLKFNEKLTRAAEKKLENMFSEGYWDHTSPKKISPWNFILEENYDYHYAGENLAKDFLTEEELVKAWMDSPDHKANILNNNYKEIGVAIGTGKLNGKQTILAVQIFGTEFGEADYRNAGISKKTKIEQSFPIIAKKLSFSEIVHTRFLVPRTMAFASVLVLMFYFAFRFNQDSKKRTFKLVMRKYWAHFVVLFFLGILTWVTGKVI